jgi:hypothetical protein
VNRLRPVALALALVLVGPLLDGSARDGRSPLGPGVFVSFCPWSHSARDDPIVHPGHQGVAHRHDFFGNRTTDAHSTGRALRRASANCSIGADRSAYWTPSLYKGGRVVRPTRAAAWYFAGGAGKRIRPFPPGLKMVAGDAGAERPQRRDVISWSCAHESQSARGAAAGVPRCARRGVLLRISFPSCWDGERRDSPNHRSHMAYRRWDASALAMRCPPSHRVAVPALVFEVEYPIRTARRARLASGAVSTAHADFFNGWRQWKLRRLTEHCLARSQACPQRERY